MKPAFLRAGTSPHQPDNSLTVFAIVSGCPRSFLIFDAPMEHEPVTDEEAQYGIVAERESYED